MKRRFNVQSVEAYLEQRLQAFCAFFGRTRRADNIWHWSGCRKAGLIETPDGVLGDEIMTKTVSVLALAFLAVAVLAVADKAQDNPRIPAEATTAISTRAPTQPPKPTPVRKYTDQQLQYWAATDAAYAWDESDIQLGPDHHFNWFEIGVKMGTATKFLVVRHGFNEADGEAYKEFFDKAFMGIGMAKQKGQLSL